MNDNRYYTIQRNINFNKKVQSPQPVSTPYLLLYNVEIPDKLSEVKKIIKLYKDEMEEYVVWHKIKDDRHLRHLIVDYKPYFYVEFIE